MASQQPADLGAAQHRQVQIEDDEIGQLLIDGAKGDVSARHNLNDPVTGPLQRVFDETRDVLFVLDDEHARRPADCASFCLADQTSSCFHRLAWLQLTRGRFPRRDTVVNCELSPSASIRGGVR